MSNGASPFQPSDVADPVDYEDFVYEHQPEFQSDPFRKLLQFPSDDVNVVKVQRPCRTVQPVMPNALAMEVAHIRDCVKTYLSDFVIFKRNYIECGYNFPGYASLDQVGGPVEFEADKPETKACDIQPTSIRDLYTHQSDIVLPSVFRPAIQSADELKDDLATSGVHFARQPNIFSLYPDSSSRHIFERRPFFEPPLEYTGHRVLVKCVNLKSEIDVEPLFASMALYDAKEKKKVSENFYFDMNTPEQKSLLSRFLSSTQDLSSMARSCIFGISHASPDLYIVVRLEKVLQAASFADCAEIYSREDVEKTRERVRQSVTANCERLGRYRMPLGWAAINLLKAIQNKPSEVATLPAHASADHRSGTFSVASNADDSSLDFAAIFETVSVRLNNFFRHEEERISDEDMFKAIAELKQKGPGGGKLKLKTFPCSLHLELSSCPPELPNCVTPELYRLHPYTEEYAVPVKELLEFPCRPIYQPHSLYRNLLYVYPRTLNLSNRNGRNIAVKVELLASESLGSDTVASNLPLIFGKSSSSELVAETMCSVSYHTKTPSFYDEIKMALPAPLTEQHHLLFTFSHVSCKQNKKSLTSLTSNSSGNSHSLETPLAYAWLPLYHDGRLSEGEFHLPVCFDHPPSGYSLLPLSTLTSALPSGSNQSSGTSGSSTSSAASLLQSIRWVDNKKPLFSISLRPVSTIYPQDDAILSFLVTTGSSQPAVTEPQLINCILNLAKADPHKLVQFMPVIFTRLLKLVTNPPLHRGQLLNIGPTCLRALCELAVTLSSTLPNLNDHLDRNKTILQLVSYFPISSNASTGRQAGSQINLRRPSYMSTASGGSETDLADREVSSISSRNYQQTQASASGNRRNVHQELVYLWMVCDKSTRPFTLSGAWLLFEIILKDLVECLATEQRLDLPRKMRCSTDFLEDLTTLVNGLIQDIIHQISAEPEVIRRLNVYLAFFLQDLFSILDRGFVFQLIRAYVQTLTTRLQSSDLSHNDATALLALRLDAFRIWASHEHFIQLNLPVSSILPAAPSPSPSTDSSISSTALGALSPTGPPALSYDYRRYHFLIGLVYSDLALTLEVGDGRLQIKSAMLIRTMFSSHDGDTRYNTDRECRFRISQLYLPLISVIADAMGPALFINKPLQGRQLQDGDRGGISNTDELDAKMKEMKFSPDATRHLIFSIVWILRNSQTSDLVKYFSEQGPVRINHVLALLKLCLNTFEHKLFSDDVSEDISSSNVEDMSWPTNMPSVMTQSSLGSIVKHWSPMRRKTTSFDSNQLPMESSAGVKRKGASTVSSANIYSPTHRSTANSFIIDTHLSTEVAMVVCDTLEIIVTVVDANAFFRGVLPSILHVASHAISLNQSTPATCRLLCIIRSLIVKFPELFFEQETEQTGDMCLRILRLCGCQTKAIRLHATATVYQLMRIAFIRNCGLPRVKMQLTTGLSALAGQVSTAAASLDNLSVSLRTLLAYADGDLEMAACSFPEQVHNLVVNLHSILCDTLKLTAAGEDFETVLDLMYRIAKGYQNSPDLRLIWLQNMAAKHSSLSNHAEAAQCLIHAAALVSEYLNLIEDRLHLPRGAAAFEKIAPNVVEDESAISDDLVSPQEDGVCTAKYFSESGLCGLMEHAVNTLVMGNNFEIAYELYAILSRVYEHYRDYKKLSHIHTRMADCCNQITKLEGRRLFATFFRVGFYGSIFGELDQEEFVYREPAITKLAEIAQRLQALHEDRFGRGVVEIIKDSNTVNRSKLDSHKAYIQVTYVEPYFDAFDQMMRITEFERNYGMRRFSFTTPFTVSGRAHGALHEQYKRRTVLTVANALPYTKTRVTVIGKQELVLSPIEVAIEDVQRKTAQLLAALTQTPIDAKMLQMILQGCISPAVNQGPVEVAHVFLVPCQQGLVVPTHFHHKLRIAFKQFLRRCGEAVHRNRTLITEDQKDYQRELERLYAQIREQLNPLIANSACLKHMPSISPAPSSGTGGAGSNANYVSAI